LIAILGGEPDIDMLPGPVPMPAGDIEDERFRSRGQRDRLDNLSETPL
jgi:hypothetical protein